MRYLARIVFASIILVACNGELALSTHNSCLVHPQLLVIPGANPVFTYPPECGLSSLHVVMVTSSTTSTQVVWSFTVSGQAMVASSIRYGSAPAGATVQQQPRALVHGQVYRVSVVYGGGGNGFFGSEATFTQ